MNINLVMMNNDVSYDASYDIYDLIICPNKMKLYQMI